MSFISKFTKRDLGFATLTGLITGIIAWLILNYLNVPVLYFGKMIPVNCEYPSFAACYTYQFVFDWIYLIVIVPVLWILGVLLGYVLGQWMEFFNQFGKFAAIGFTNAAVTFGVLNLLIAHTGYTAGQGYTLISSASFVVGMLSSYIWNKFWAFNAARSRGGRAEFFKFVAVTLVALLVNTTVASVVVNFAHPVLGLDAKQWANIGAVVGSAVALIFSFVGFRVAVFK